MCSVRVCVLFLLVGCGIVGPCSTIETCHNNRWAYPPSNVTFDPHELLPGACQEVKDEAMAVNEADYTSEIVWTVGPEDRQRRCEVVWWWCCSAHTGNEVSSCVGGVAEWL